MSPPALLAVPPGPASDDEPTRRPRQRTPLRRRPGLLLCAVGLHRMRYAGVQLGQRIERCERCGRLRVVR